MRSRKLVHLSVFWASACFLQSQTIRDFSIPENALSKSVLVVGFLGGFERWNDPHRGVRKLALSLQALNLPNLYVATIENRHQDMATELIRSFVGRRSQWTIKCQPRVILYGQSWGGAAVIHVASELEKSGIAVQLTVQVDSVGFHDWLVPSNVRNAANIYERDLLGIGGRAKIQAEDPKSTRILENTHISYLLRSYRTLNKSDTPWVRRTFGGSHAKMESDGRVWAHVKALILAAISNEP